jgi:poly-beta-1,6-N-acetyl-D-glucosamine synthase
VEHAARSDARIRLVREEERRGKVAAVNTALRLAGNEIVALVDADCQPAPGSLRLMLDRLEDRKVGGVGTRNVPSNADESMVARAAALMWELHHAVNQKAPVLGGDAIAFRRVFESLPEAASVNDDFLIETELRRRGLRVVYEPAAVTMMRVPTTAADFLVQRRRIHSGFLLERRASGRFKSTQQPLNVLKAAAGLIVRRPAALAALTLMLALDTLARAAGYLDVVRGRASRHARWQPAATTKQRLPS